MTVKTESIEIDGATAAALKERAAERGVTVSQLVAELVPLAVDDETIADLKRRWAEVVDGQRTIPHDEIESWLRTWGSADFRPWNER